MRTVNVAGTAGHGDPLLSVSPQFGSVPPEKLYALLPAIQRIRDTAQGEPLRALLAIIEQGFNTLERDIEGLYDNWFIETCDEWVVPYIGNLLYVRELYAKVHSASAVSSAYGQQERRAYVANTLAYRRRKGTVPVLEQLVQDITGWRSRAVEFFQLLATTQNINHERPGNTTVNLRAGQQPEELGTPFERQASYTLQVRNREQDRYNLAIIGLFIWRLRSYANPLSTNSTARLVRGDRGYTFDPTGFSQNLFNQPQTATDITRLTREINVPAPLRNTALIKELENFRHRQQLQAQLNALSEKFDLASQKQQQTLKTELQKAEAEIPQVDRYLDAPQPVFQVMIDGEPVATEDIQIKSLNWETSDSPQSTESINSPEQRQARVAVDPEQGRLWCVSPPQQSVEVRYAYGFSGDVGSSVYDRQEPLAQVTTGPHLQWCVTPGGELSSAIARWNQLTLKWQTVKQPKAIALGQVMLDVEARLISWQANPYTRGVVVVAATGNRDLIVQPGAITTTRTANSSSLQVKQPQTVVFPPDYGNLTLTLWATPVSDTSAPDANAPNANDETSAIVDAVPNIDRGVIILSTSRTYCESIAVNVAADKQLAIVAANGQRPHLLGDIYVRGVATAQDNPGTLILDGLLLEGRFQLLAGQLQHLQIRHCTFVPLVAPDIQVRNTDATSGGIHVDGLLSSLTREWAKDNAEDIDWTPLMALWMYLLVLIQRIIQIGFDSKQASGQKNIHKLWWLGLRQLGLLSQVLQQVFQFFSKVDDDDLEDLLDYPIFQDVTRLPNLALDNAALTVTIKRSITGPLTLAETVPALVSTDSLIHQGWTIETPLAAQTGAAIAALGAHAQINTTTIFGTAQVRELSASNSLFTGRVMAQIQQSGCVRFCSLPRTSKTPSRYRCQPDLALSQRLDRLPSKITALVQQPNTQVLWAATAGDGLYARNMTMIQARTQSRGNSAGTWQTSKPSLAGQTQEQPVPLLNDSLADMTITAFTIAPQGISGTVFLAGTGLGELWSSNNPAQGWQRLQVNLSTPTGILDTAITALLVATDKWFMGTAGSGLFYSTDRGNTWTWLEDLPQRQITCLLATDSGRLLVGTYGGLYFYDDVIQAETITDPQWQVVERGLPAVPITCLAQSTLDQLGEATPSNPPPQGPPVPILVGTQTDGVFHSTDNGFFWRSIGLNQWPITTLIAKTKRFSNTLSSESTTVTIEGDQFSTHLKPGDAITVDNQTRVVCSINNDESTLIIERPFCPDISPAQTFESVMLLAGTAGGGLFRSMDSGDLLPTWTRGNTSSTTDWVSAIAWVEPTEASNTINEPVMLASALGNFLYTQDNDPDRRWNANSWESANQGLTAVETLLQEISRLQPSFTANEYGKPGFGQLARGCPIEIVTGAEDGSEMGAFSYLKQPQREANLLTSLDEYLRFGLSANLFYLT